jgi:mono/diheme cytochrome c family protein
MAHMRFNATLRWIAVFLVVCWVVTTRVLAFATDPPATPIKSTANDVTVTAVTGESWLNHLHRDFGETSMGKTGRLGPADTVQDDAALGTAEGSSASGATRRVTLHGSDIYRLNCQGCHGEAGLGVPPEIGSVVDPVRGTSVPLVMERMKKVGMAITRAEALQLATQANGALLKRLNSGGKDMPAFPQLSEAEIRALLGYLKQLAGVPGAAREQLAVEESPVRVGELIVKSTCHTCHSAVGANPGPQQLLQGAIPPLSTLCIRTTRAELVRKVTSGAPVNMGSPPMPYRGRMPVFFYLSKDEAADVYQYLTKYKPSVAGISVAATSTPMQEDKASARTESVLPRSFLPSGGAEWSYKGRETRLVWELGFFVTVLLVAGCVVTVRELKRLSAESAIRRWEMRDGGDSNNLRASKVSPIRTSASSNVKSISNESDKRKASGLRR